MDFNLQKTHGHIKNTMLQLEKTVEMKEKALDQIYKARKQLEAMEIENQQIHAAYRGHNIALDNGPKVSLSFIYE